MVLTRGIDWNTEKFYIQLYIHCQATPWGIITRCTYVYLMTTGSTLTWPTEIVRLYWLRNYFREVKIMSTFKLMKYGIKYHCVHCTHKNIFPEYHCRLWYVDSPNSCIRLAFFQKEISSLKFVQFCLSGESNFDFLYCFDHLYCFQGGKIFLRNLVTLPLQMHIFILENLKLLEHMGMEQKGHVDTAFGVLFVLLLSLPFQ